MGWDGGSAPSGRPPPGKTAAFRPRNGPRGAAPGQNAGGGARAAWIPKDSLKVTSQRGIMRDRCPHSRRVLTHSKIESLRRMMTPIDIASANAYDAPTGEQMMRCRRRGAGARDRSDMTRANGFDVQTGERSLAYHNACAAARAARGGLRAWRAAAGPQRARDAQLPEGVGVGGEGVEREWFGGAK